MAKVPWTPEIREKRLLLVEGAHEEMFFNSLLRHLHLTGIQPVDGGGKDQMKQRLSLITKDSEFPTVIRIAVIRDADNDGSAAFDSVVSCLRSNRLPIPTQQFESVGTNPRIQVVILPSINETGSLETLCLKSIIGKPEYSCVVSYFDCLASNGIVIDRLTDKNRVQVYLAHHEKDFLHTGLAAKEKVWNFNHNAFKILSDFLTEFAS